MIEVKNLTKAYGNFVAIKDVSFKAESGSILGFLGPNGAGKTTTMRIITGYMPATAGTVLIDGLDIFSQSLEARRKIGYLPENPPLYPDMRVEAYLRFVAKLRDVPRANRFPGSQDVVARHQDNQRVLSQQPEFQAGRLFFRTQEGEVDLPVNETGGEIRRILAVDDDFGAR